MGMNRKEYMKEYNKMYYKKHHKELAEYSRKYRENNKAKISVKKRKYYLEHRDSILKSKKIYYSNNKRIINNRQAKWRMEKTNNAIGKVQVALLNGTLTKGVCQVCGSAEVEAHHCDYNKPLDVMWLCRDHHAQWHKNNKPIYV